MYEKSLMVALRKAFASRDVAFTRDLLSPMHAADIADIMEELEKEERVILFRYLHKDVAAEVFTYLSQSSQLELIDTIKADETADLVNRLYVDEATDLLEELPANTVREILENTPREKRELLNKFLKYPEDSAGSVMSVEFISVRPELTVKEAIEQIRHNKNRLVSVSQVYVTTREHQLVGVLSIRELLSADDNQIIKDIMRTKVISLETDTDQEEAMQTIQKYALMALPVTDSEKRLVGIFTVDDALDISQEEATDDIAIMNALSPSEQTYFESTVFDQTKTRIVWLLLLMVSGLINGAILGQFESAIAVMPFLVTFIPMLTDTGGNAGSQSSALIIRGLAVGEVEPRDAFKVIWKEFRVALCAGLVLATVSFLRVIIFQPHNALMGFVVGFAVLLIVIMSKIVGGTLPLIAEKFGLDPALMAAPIITTLVDAGGLVVYFLLAKAVFHI